MMTSDKDYGVRVVIAYEDKVVGQVIYPPGMLRQSLIERNLVVSAAPTQPEKRPVGRPRIHPRPGE